jgi:hypothetical protein
MPVGNPSNYAINADYAMLFVRGIGLEPLVCAS